MPPNAAALIAHQRLTIEKLRREIYGARSERKLRLLDQLELEVEELKPLRPKMRPLPRMPLPPPRRQGGSFNRKKPSRKPFPADLPRERVLLLPDPTACACC